MKVAVAGDCVEPGLIQPPKHIVRFLPTVTQVSHRKQPVLSRVEADGPESSLQGREAALDAANGDIAAELVAPN